MTAFRSFALALVAALVVTACGHAVAASTSHGRPVDRTAPATAPHAAHHHNVCEADRPGEGSGSGTHGLVWVRRHPAGVVAIWLPGLNRTHCHSRRTVIHRGGAMKLAHAVEHAKRVPNGVYHCPNDDGTAVDLYFRYANSRDEFVDVPLSGCRFLAAPHRQSRVESKRFVYLLKARAPDGWQRDV